MFNLAFIDGDHRFEQVLDDFIALEHYAAPGAVVLLHDTLPLTESTAGGARHTGFYSGDAWKVLPCLRALRPDLRLTTLPTAATAVGFVVEGAGFVARHCGRRAARSRALGQGT